MKKIILFSFCLILHFGVQAADVRTVATTAGQLGTDASAFLGTVTDLTITGTIDDRDFVILRDSMLLLATLDLSGVSIVAFEGSGGTYYQGINSSYPANEIPELAFYNLEKSRSKASLTSVILPPTITSIGIRAFYGAGLTAITIPDWVSTIGYAAFAYCEGLTAFNMPFSVTTIGGGAFTSCTGLTNLTIPPSVTFIGTGAFQNCTGLTSLKVYAIDLENFYLDANAFIGLNQTTCTLHVPFGAKPLYEAADQWKNFTTIVEAAEPPATMSVNSTANGLYPAFITSGGDLATVTNLTVTGVIDDRDFVIMRDYMPLLATVDLSEVNIVEFEGNGGTAVFGSYRNYPANQIPDYAFFDQVTSTFKTSLKVIIPPKSITSIGGLSLTGTGITTFTVPSLVTFINGSFYNCPDLIECILPASLTFIGNSTFFVCQNLKYITIPDAVTTIGAQAFERCSSLPSINIPAGVTSIGMRAFLDCSALSNIKVYAVDPANILLGASVFYNVDILNCTLQVPSGTKALYEAADQWKSFKTIVEGFVAPTVATKPTTNIGATTATGNATITSLGDVNPTQHGVVWSTAHNPDVSLSTKTTQGVISTAGDFTSDISGLEPGTTYYVRAYATNNVGTSYGDEVAFNTLASQTISFGALVNKTYGDAAFNLAATTSAAGLTITYISDNEAVAKISGSTLSIMGAGEANITAKQAGNDTYSAAADVTQKIIVNKRAITITADSKTKIYGDTDPGLTAQVTSGTIVTGDVATGSLTRAAGEVVADYAISKGAYTYGSNYEETYVGANLTIDKLSINVRAVVDTKIYDGTNSSSASPTYDALVNGDVVNTAPIQIFDNATVGTAHVLTASGLTINNGGADATGNYVINYIPTNATGVIQAKQVSVTDPTITVSKVYDSNITAVVIAGLLSEVIPADVNNVTITATASYSDASAGAAKIITVHYTLSGSASGSYIAPADYTLATAEITRKQLTISTPVVVTNKMLDGSSTAMITTIGTLQGVETGDVNDVTVTATANYNNSAVGSNKTITVVYTLDGSAKDNYFAPANDVIPGAKISDQITLNPLATPVSGCENAELDLAYTILTGTPTQYKITFNSAAVAAGIQHVSYTNLPTDDTSGNLSITIPGGTPDGDYQGSLQLKNELGIESPAYAFQFTINVSSDYIISKFDDVVLCDNSAHRFTGYQWYKNGVAINGATKQFYNDLGGLVGSYSLRLTTADGKTLFTCSKELNITLSQEVNVYPNPVKSSQTCFVEVLGFETIDFSGAELTVNTLQGIQIYHSNKVQKINSINLPDIPGMYVGHVTMVGGKKYVFKVNVE